MEYLQVENWEMIRSLLGILIALVSVLYIKKQSRPNFNKALNKEFSNKNYRKIKKQVERLKEENERAHQLLAKVNSTSSLFTLEEKKINRKEVKNARANNKMTQNKHHHAALHTKTGIDNRTPKNPYEQVRLFLASGMSKEEIYDKLDIPTAEIDLMLKFNSLAQTSQLGQRTATPIRAYG